MIALEQLEKFIDKSQTILKRYKPNEERDTFTISGYAHYENVLSNWLAFFFDSNAEHGFHTLFGDAMRNAVLKKAPNASLDWIQHEFQSAREVITEGGNYIDLVVYNEGDPASKTFENCLIIEHKVYAALYNDLDDYYNSMKAAGDKCAVLLSATERNDLHLYFINLSYAEFINEIKVLLGKYQLQAKHRYILYLNDLLTNMDTLSSNTGTEDIKFCFTYGQELMELANLKYATENKLIEQVMIAIADTGFEYNKRYQYSFSLKAEQDRVSVVFPINELFTEKKCKVQFWIRDEYVQLWNEVNDISTLLDYCREHGFEASQKKEAKSWVEIAKGDFYYDSESNKNFGEQVKDYCETDLAGLLRVIKKLIGTE